MAKYIEREKLLGTISELQRICATEVLENKVDIYNDVFEEIYGIMLSIPSADVQEVKHGKWIKEKRSVLVHWHCSVCKDCYYLDEPNAEYCPHCGAKMDGKEGKNG